jgi:hypothetical protein
MASVIDNFEVARIATTEKLKDFGLKSIMTVVGWNQPFLNIKSVNFSKCLYKISIDTGRLGSSSSQDSRITSTFVYLELLSRENTAFAAF